MIPRELEKIISARINHGKIIILLGPRQTGKTTLVKKILAESTRPSLYLNGDEPDIREMLTNTTSTQLKALIGNKKLVAIDEAQRIRNIGLTLKLIVDNLQDVQVLATGSSALELSNEINEPLTGRKYEYFLYPLSFKEMANYQSTIEEKRMLEHRMIFGYYPEVVTKPGQETDILKLIAESYLYKDLFSWQDIKKPVLLEKLLQALALQLGNQVSFRELGQLLGADNETIERYIDLLEKAFIVFKLTSLSRNMRNELKKSRKIYFYDNGIRNAILNNFRPLGLREDTGALWENFMISERLKKQHYAGIWFNKWFWRTHAQQEIDYIEEYGGVMAAYEFKWNPRKKAKISKSFLDKYKVSTSQVVTKDNFLDFVW